MRKRMKKLGCLNLKQMKEINDIRRMILSLSKELNHAIIKKLSRQESRSSAGNKYGAEQAGITQLSMQ